MSYYDSSYFNPTTEVVSQSISTTLVWTIIALVLAVVGGITLYFTLFNKNKEGKYKGIISIIYDLVQFKYFIIDDIYRILYLISTIAVTLLSFNFFGNWRFLIFLIGGNIVLRISYEILILFIQLCHDVRNLNNKK